jgi:hypothetical protein
MLSTKDVDAVIDVEIWTCMKIVVELTILVTTKVCVFSQVSVVVVEEFRTFDL